MNVVIQDGLSTNDINSVLAPVNWKHLEPFLGEVIGEQVDVSEHLDSYQEWKDLAQQGKAGLWTCSPADILTAVRRNCDE